ncbi:MAG: S8 family serine peptidase [Woeseiaceae bacterium]|nr:S8 family serine peptidase [Woeseiaceae bacterium]
MNTALPLAALVLSSLLPAVPAAAQNGDPERDILVTIDNQGARARGTSAGAPYRNRKRYSIAPAARRNADEVRDEYSLQEISHWPIRSLSIYCIVYRVRPGVDLANVIERLRGDKRIESVQPLHEFETSVSLHDGYDDKYANLQRGLAVLSIGAAHRISRGQGIRIAIIDSGADYRHEDLRGRVSRIDVFADKKAGMDLSHGTAVASVIGANANNAKGIVGISPEASLEVFVACWADDASDKTLCNSFTLAKALDALLEDPPHILNMSLTGPFDPLLARLLGKVTNAGVFVVVARPEEPTDRNRFPASLETVIGVGNSDRRQADAASGSMQDLYAPGEQIMVAVPNDAYDFRSGSSLAAAHVSGAIALLLAVSPGLTFDSVLAFLRQSQDAEPADTVSINACIVLKLADPSRVCQLTADNSG